MTDNSNPFAHSMRLMIVGMIHELRPQFVGFAGESALAALAVDEVAGIAAEAVRAHCDVAARILVSRFCTKLVKALEEN